MIQICGVTLNKNNELTLRACVWDKTGSRYTYDHEAHKAVIWRMLEEQVPEIVSSEEFRREFREKSVTALIKELRRNPNDAWEFEEIAERAFKKDKTSYQQRVSELYQQSIDLKNQAKELKRRAKL